MKNKHRDIKNNALSLLKNNNSIRKVAKICGVGKSTVQEWWNKHLSNLKKNLGGRPTKLSLETKHACIRAITSGGYKSPNAITTMLSKDLDIKVNSRTVRRALNEGGLKAAEKEKKPRLSEANIKAWLDFALTHKDWTIADWKRIIWSDETKINRFCSDGRCWYWKRDEESMNSRHVKQTVKYGGGSLMVWGCMTTEGPGYLCQIDGNMDQYLYKNILEDELWNTIEYYNLDPNGIIFQQDNDSKHTAKSIKEWFAEQPFKILNWPAQSPDLNPMEHLWAHLKRSLNTYNTPPSGMLELWDRIEAKWNTIDKDICLNLIESLPKRIKAVIKAKGK
jgi:transposase